MLLQPKHHDIPFPYFSVDPAFSDEECALLESLFVQEGEWQHRDGAFYRCSLRDVSESVPEGFKAEIIDRMRDITGLPLVNELVVTAQRMLPGQVIGIHSDRPLMGYEAARVVVQFNRDWQPEHGGILELYASPEGEVVARASPEYNGAFGFLLHAESYHGVTEVTELRQTVVFNFWHEGNTPELAEYVLRLFSDLHFSELPDAIDAVAAGAESSLPEEVTLLAGTAAIALHRWGYDVNIVEKGYLHSAGIATYDANDEETNVAILLADWVAFLYRDSFDLARWDILESKLKGVEKFPAVLLEVGRLCAVGGEGRD